MTVDLNKQIENIDYNYLNLPDKITVYTDSYDYLAYVYDASGTKLRKLVTDGLDISITDYTGSFVFTDNELAFIITPEGRAIPDSSGNFTYQYYLKDHLGNTRVTYTQKGEVLQDNNYYPFGMSTGEATNYIADACLENKYLYNGKELDDDLGVGWYDYGARFYDPQIGRWHVVDPMADDLSNISYTPYHYTINNPIRFIDPNGMWVDQYELNRKTGEIKKVQESDNDVVYAVINRNDGTSERTGESIEFSGEVITITSLGKTNEDMYASIIEVSNTSDGDALFNFVIEQTGDLQEWSILDYSVNGNNPTSKVSTSGFEKRHPIATNQIEDISNKPGNKITRFDHNHPSRDTQEYSSKGDRDARDKVLKNNKDAKVNIFFRGKNNQKWFHRSIRNDTKVHFKGEFN